MTKSKAMSPSPRKLFQRSPRAKRKTYASDASPGRQYRFFKGISRRTLMEPLVGTPPPPPRYRYAVAWLGIVRALWVGGAVG